MSKAKFNRLSDEQKAEIVHMYTSGEFRASEIAEMFTINQQTVYNTLAKAGVKPNGGKKPVHNPSPSSPDTAKEVIAEPNPIPAVKTCKKCAKEINAEFLYCPYCGEKSKSEGELILDGLLAARAKAVQYVPSTCRDKIDKQLLDASEYLRFLMKKTGHM